MIRIVAFSGSHRQGSYNQQLVKLAVAGAQADGATVTVLNLSALALPILNPDLLTDGALPAPVLAFQQQLRTAHGLLIASPEYNGFFTPLLKNALDWASRRIDEQPSVFTGQYAAVMAASPGKLGGMRGLLPLRQLLTGLGVTVLAEQMTLPEAGQALTEQGQLLDPALQREAEALGAKLSRTLSALQVGS
ncbi:MAG: NAD(P)H-dependent oxidoreductase [Methylococcales bacterium]|nr:NAD(P)H-dependent oxidoreductase [Methylococcales bacterium]